MDDDLLDARTGHHRRHDGRDPWSLMTRAEALVRRDLGEHVPSLPPEAPGPIAVGGYVLLLLVRERADLQGRYEALWAEVTGQDDLGFDAVLDNQPTWIRGLASGDAIRFEGRHVLRFRG